MVGCAPVRLSHTGQRLCRILPSTKSVEKRNGHAGEVCRSASAQRSCVRLDYAHSKQGAGLIAYDQYIKDAEAANSPECAAFFRKVHDADKAQLAEAKEHLIAVLQGKMGSPSKK